MKKYTIVGGDSKEYGPVSVQEVSEWISSGRANGETRIKEEGAKEWSRLRDLEVFQELLPTLDALEKGLSSLEEVLENSELETYRQGYEFILREVRSVLDKFGVTEIPGLGSSFDPNIHEAILREVTSDHTDGEILDEFRKGYKLQHRLLRPVQVRVAVKPEKTADTEEKKEE